MPTASTPSTIAPAPSGALRRLWLALLASSAAVLLLIALSLGMPGPSAALDAALPVPQRVADRRCTIARPCLALVIDDIGRDPARLEQALRLPLPLTFAVLPHARHTASAVAALRRARREYLLHLPLQPSEEAEISDEPLVISTGSSIRAVFREMVRRVPGAVGFNNHMGSFFCRSKDAVGALVETAKEHFRFVLDSKTTKDSRLCAAARAVGSRCVERDVFLDDPGDVTTVDYSLQRALQQAAERGWAIAIGHPKPATLSALARFAQRRHVDVVPLSVLVWAKGP